MDAKVIFWTGAFINMGVIVALASAGVRARRSGDIASHRRLMLASAALVGVFLLSYVFKVMFLGREDMSVWSPYAVWVLRFHETCVLVMLLAGFIAARRGRALAGTRNVTLDPADPVATPGRASGHSGAGRVAVWSAVLGLCSAAIVLFDMYRRTGIL